MTRRCIACFVDTCKEVIVGTLCLLLHICVVQWLLLNLLARKSVFLLEPNKPRPHSHIVILLRGRNDSSISYAMNRLVLLVRDLDFDQYARAGASYGRLHTTAISCKFLTFPPDFLITPARHPRLQAAVISVFQPLVLCE